MHKTVIYQGRARPRRHRRAAWLSLLLAAASCVPAGQHLALAVPSAVELELAAAPPRAAALPAMPAQALNVALPLSEQLNPAALPFVGHSLSGRDERRSLDCLTSAVYYEAASESEPGQRAVAQVVLNRVRHPGYPDSVCGVVFQGPMRTVAGDLGGGCQFTFTCDGSLLRTPSATGWIRARRIAADALSGTVYAPVGLATHYHADYVLPAWAATLSKVAAIGAHIFYRLPGEGGAPSSFRQAYAGREPAPVPARSYVAPVAPAVAATLPAPAAADDRLPPVRYTALAPLSQVREQYRNSGMPLADLR